MSEVRFTVPGVPRPWDRARPISVGGKTRMITSKKTRSEEGAIRWMAQVAMQGRDPFDCALDMEMTAYLPIPASWSKKKQAEAIQGTVFPTGRPDVDNIAKAVLDGMNSIVYRDDALVVRIVKQKLYGSQPRIEIVVRPRVPDEGTAA